MNHTWEAKEADKEISIYSFRTPEIKQGFGDSTLAKNIKMKNKFFSGSNIYEGPDISIQNRPERLELGMETVHKCTRTNIERKEEVEVTENIDFSEETVSGKGTIKEYVTFPKEEGSRIERLDALVEDNKPFAVILEKNMWSGKTTFSEQCKRIKEEIHDLPSDLQRWMNLITKATRNDSATIDFMKGMKRVLKNMKESLINKRSLKPEELLGEVNLLKSELERASHNWDEISYEFHELGREIKTMDMCPSPTLTKNLKSADPSHLEEFGDDPKTIEKAEVEKEIDCN
jgi:hypothetical protein